MFSEDEIKKLEVATAFAEVQNLMGAYIAVLGYDNYRVMMERVFPMDHPDCEFEMVERGAYVGPEQMKAYFDELIGMHEGKGPGRPGMIPLQFLGTPMIEVDENCQGATGQWVLLSPHAMPIRVYPNYEKVQGPFWFGGGYDNRFVKTEQGWKLLKNHVFTIFRTPYDKGWVLQPDSKTLAVAFCGNPAKPGRIYLYNPAVTYTSDGAYNWSPDLG